MIPVLFKEDEQIFTHNGIGALYESLSCDVIEEENGAFTMELEYPVDGEWFSEIKDFRIIQAKPNDIDEPHNFRIYEIEKSIDELTVYVRANTRTNDLGNNLITNYIGDNVTPQQAMNGIKSNLIEPTNFDLISDIQTRSNVEWTRINPLNAIVGVRGSLVDIWGGQIKRTNTAIHLYSRRGRDNVVTIRPGKNIEGLNMTVSTAGLVTKILPTFSYRPVDVPKYQMVTMSDGTKEKRRVTASGSTTLRDDITVLGDVVSSQYVDNYPTNYWSSVDYGDDNELRETIDDYIDARLTAAEESPTILDMRGFENDLQNFVKTELDKKANQYFIHRNPGVDRPTVRITVNMLQLSDSPDWEEFKDLERIGLTDTLDVWVEEYDIDVEVRVTTLTYDSIGEQVTIFNAGSNRAPKQSAIEKKYDDLTKATNDYITSFKNGVQNIMRNTADGLNRKFEGYTEPPAELSSEGDIWFKQIGEGKVEIWIHDGVYWQPLMTEEFGKKIEADMLAQQKDIDDAKEAADEAVRLINDDILGKFTVIDQDLLDIEAISNTAQINARTALDQSLEALGNASTALTNAQTAIDSSSDAATLAGNALTKADEAQDAAIILSGQVSGFETTVAGFNQTVNNYEGEVSGFRNDILGLESTVAGYATEVDEFGNTVSTYATEVSTMRNTVSGFESTVATYGTEVSDLAGEVLGYKNQVSTFNNTVTGFNSTVANYTTEVDEFGTEVASYATEVSTLTNTVSGFQSTVSRVEQDYEDVSGTVATHTSQISNLDGEIALKASTSSVNTLTGRVSTAETGITANADAIKLKASTTSVNALTGRVSTAESSITANATAIGLKASQSTVDTLTGTVNTLSGRVDVTAGQISSKVWKTDIKTAVDGIDIGGRNYFLKPTLELYYDTSTKIHDDGSVTLVQSGGNPQVTGLWPRKEALRPVAGNKYTLSYGTLENRDVRVLFFIYEDKDMTIPVTTGVKRAGVYHSLSYRAWYRDRFPSSGDTIELPDNAKYIAIGFQNTDTTNTRTTLEWVKFETGNVATDWTPALEDTTALINHVESELTQKYDSITATVSSIDGRVATNRLDLNGLTTTVQSVETDLTGTTTLLNTTKITVDSHTSSISTLRTDVDGKATTAQFNTLTSTVNGTIQRVGDAEGKITTIETNVSGLQTTVASKAAQSQVTQLSNSLTSTITEVEGNSTQIAQNATNINLRVEKGDVLSQINIEAGRTLIESKKLVLDANSVVFTGSAFIPSAQIQSLTADKITTGTLNAANVKIINLDFETAVGNATEFIRSEWNNITTQISIDETGINMYGNGEWHRNYFNETGIEIWGEHGSNYKAGAIGHFVATGTAHVNQNKMINNLGRFSVGIGTNRLYDLSLGTSQNNDNIYSPSINIRGENGTIEVFKPIIIGSNTGTGFLLETRMHHDRYGAHLVNYNNSFNRLFFASDGTMHVESAREMKFYTNSGALSFRADYLGLHLQNRDLNNVKTINYASDIRLKDKIEKRIEDDLATIMKIDYKNYIMSGEKHRGFIAQELREIDSDLITEGGNGMLGYDGQGYMNTIGHAVQILGHKHNSVATIVDSHSDTIHTLQQEISRLNRRIEELEGVM